MLDQAKAENEETTMEPKKLLANIKQVFVEQEKYQFDQHVPEFMVDEKLLGDCYSVIMVEPKGSLPPRFYHTFSPFDVISNKAPDRALVFENGKLLLNIDFAQYIDLRTGAMDALLLQGLGVKSLNGTKILYLGAGKVAQASLEILKNQFNELSEVDCINNSGNLAEINGSVQKFTVKVNQGSLENLGNYDFIFCHTNAKEVLLTKDLLNKLKKGVVITTYISSTDHGEVAAEYYNLNKANIICDWELTLSSAKDLKRAIDGGLLKEKDAIVLKDLFSGKKAPKGDKHYTIYRSVGTPMQNLATLQILVSEQSK